MAAAWADARAEEAKSRDEAIARRTQSILAGQCAWAPQVLADWREPVYQPRADIPPGMVEDIRRGQRREKKIHNVAVSD